MAGAAVSRIERLAALLDEPLLVTSGVNVRYLTGLQSSNAAVLVEPDGEATLYTDFRYAQKAQALEGVRFEQTARAVIGDLSTRLAGRTIWIEADVVTVSANEQLRDGGVDTVAESGLVERLRAIKEPAEIQPCARLRVSLTESSARSRRSSSRAAPSGSWPGVSASSSTSTAPRSSHSTRSSRPPRTAPARMPTSATPRSPRTRSSRSTQAAGSTATHPTARAHSRRASCRTSWRARTRSASKRSSPGLEAYGPGVSGRDADAAARDVITAAGWGEQFGHGLGHGIGLDVHELPAARAESTDTFEAGNVISCEPGIYIPGLGGVRIEDMVLVTDEGGERMTNAGKELTTVR